MPDKGTTAEAFGTARSKQRCFGVRRNLGKGRGQGRVAPASIKILALDLRLPDKPLKEPILIRSAPSPAMFPSEVAFYLLVHAIVAKMRRTIIVRINYLHIPYEKRHSNIAAHVSPCFRVKEGDQVTIGQCRPLSKTVRFNVLKVIPAGSAGGGQKAFTAT
ncbi:hypothetical protein RJ639_041151 [Escallonia herrerae]|uniref:40S ribosomal protein S11 n=1 Tax=Escallonia herrerae TaxID=1293975 RepID=A0AA89B3M7_9ASTE|nr:hypothetical protein RJ639_041151 [Escallonia herrerae]